MSKTGSAYAAAGVDIDVKMNALKAAKEQIKTTRTSGSLSDIGAFGGLFKSPGRDFVLVSSIDGVGTKLKVAEMARDHRTVGEDIVNHCVNDILVQGAAPLFFLDYVGTSRLESDKFAQIIHGLCKACRENGCALVGGETAEMPGLYPNSEYDLVGIVVGAVARKNLITGKTVKAGDVIIGLPSSGLHTNGYSLARKVIFETAGLDLRDPFPGTRKKVKDMLLAVHRSYLKPVQALMQKVTIRAMAHITGGGFPDNLPRVLPKGHVAVIDRSSWKMPPLFRFIQEKGRVDRDEMFRVFNMGIGLTIVVRAADARKAFDALVKAGEKPTIIGWIEKGAGDQVRMIN